MKMRRESAVLLTLLAMTLATACGGGGDGTVGGGGGGSVTLNATFVPDQATPGADTASLAQGSANANDVIVQVNVTDTDGVHSAAFDIVWNPAMLDFVGYAPGNLLEQNSTSATYNVGQSNGRIVVGASRSGNVGVNVVGTKTLINLTFHMKEVGTTPVAIQNASLRDGALTEIASISWFGGSCVGN